jgi:CRISPR-associated protein Cmr1
MGWESQLAALSDVSLEGLGSADEEVVLDVEPWLLGGGAKTRRCDPIHWVRPPSILGQVRNIWRLTFSANSDPSAANLKKQEGALFGAESGGAPFGIDVEVLSEGREVKPPGLGQEGGYVAFSARQTREAPAAEMREGVRVAVRLRWGRAVEDKDQVSKAFRLWTLIGGVGGRTRRGLGAVQGDRPPADFEALSGELAKVDRGREKPSGMRSIQSIWLTRPFDTALDCLFALEAWYAGYRQHRRDGSGQRPGRSYWDEPELIRQLTRSRARQHQALPTPQGKHAAGWARGVLGLPIVFFFKDGRDGGDPRPSTLQARGAGNDRFASPLWFRPVRLGDGSYRGVVVRLSGPYVPAGGFVLKAGREIPVPVTTQIDRVFDDLFAAGGDSLGLREVKTSMTK